MLALLVAPANEWAWAQVAALTAEVHDVTGDTADVDFVGRGTTGDQATEAAEQQDIYLAVIKLHQASAASAERLPQLWRRSSRVLQP